MTAMHIAIVNRSVYFANKTITLVRIAEACMEQMVKHVAPAWGMLPPSVAWYANENEVPFASCKLVVKDDLPPRDATSGMLAMHTEDDGGFYGDVYCTPILANGGTDTAGANSIGVGLGHEAIEMFLDPAINRGCLNFVDGYYYDLEAVDWVEGDAYTMTNGVWMPNFCLPSAFDAIHSTAPYDYMQRLRGPFTLAHGGYWSRTDSKGTSETQFGERFPEWKKEYKARTSGRGARRMQQHAHRKHKHRDITQTEES